jgi:acyl-coenzyme A synthetase/AMP-(fatty) acid ligase
VAVVAAPGATLAARDVIDHVQRRLASYKKPSLVYFVDALPRNASLKVRKDELRSLVAEGSLDGAATGGYN